MKTKTIYLASPYGFSDHWKTKLLPDFINILESMGIRVFEPFIRNNEIDLTIPGWSNRVAHSNFQDLSNSDAIFAIVNGSPPDEGVMIEVGIAIALGKSIFLFRDDFRKCTDSDEYPLNLMVFLGIPYESWEDYYYRSLSEIENKNKAIYRWLKKEL
tara:strand:+ start:75 stop:545 length:471 start_codon:yes stop_codon:yes gene_type:complete